MRESTTVRVSRQTRDELRLLADDDEMTLDGELLSLVRAERQRRIGRALSTSEVTAEDQQWLDLGIESVRANDARR